MDINVLYLVQCELFYVLTSKNSKKSVKKNAKNKSLRMKQWRFMHGLSESLSIFQFHIRIDDRIAKKNYPAEILQKSPKKTGNCCESLPGFLHTKSHFWKNIYLHSLPNSLLVGGLNPSEKYESQLGWWHSQYMESHKSHVPVTTNQYINIYIYILSHIIHILSHIFSHRLPIY